MKLIHCPGCRNQIAAGSEFCPVCGCNPRRRRITRVVKWLLVLLSFGWAAEQLIARKLAAHHSIASHVDPQHHT
jgi:hypothetical protein